eukprot:15453542-Alexandrium_andersonii.AAC.1
MPGTCPGQPPGQPGTTRDNPGQPPGHARDMPGTCPGQPPVWPGGQLSISIENAAEATQYM